ncbi:hypothetical protein GMDG_04424 [Pseudogymnoascus destructans 20631-21]|uniref:alpha-galactosidase n=2 Tax=Pseudogymnoascus destructans TaxID=655981 RepID=L8GAU9_PSED2|nr:hypothetical protein GMDG_04424 [Pseudogymnoascus destructans 20631-21]
MGYDTYNAFEKNYDGVLALEQARLMKEFGLVDAGYNTFILDDFYALENRSETGEMIPDPAKFPDGMLNMSQSLNKYGLSASAYSSNRYKTCGGLLVAYGRELQDLETWRSWGWGGKGAIVKYDQCAANHLPNTIRRFGDSFIFLRYSPNHDSNLIRLMIRIFEA